MSTYAPAEVPQLRDRLLSDSEKNRVVIDTMHEKPGMTAEANTLALSIEGSALFFVDDVMSELVNQSGDLLSQAGLMRHDLPSEAGMAYLDLNGVPQIWSWLFIPSDGSDSAPHGIVHLTFYVEREAYRTLVPERTSDDRIQFMPLFTYDNSCLLTMHEDGGKVRISNLSVMHDSESIEAANLANFVMKFSAFCYLLRQRVTEQTEREPSRAEKRRAKREGREAPSVRVIALRSSSGTGTGQSARDYIHRWMVRGHWRRQWYATIQAHRPVFVAPHVKGPDGAPMLGGEKVYKLGGES